MRIISFESTEDHIVTLHMGEMVFAGGPPVFTVYIGSQPIGEPDEVSFVDQTIAFSAAGASQSGQISILASFEDGGQETATSVEEYIVEETEHHGRPNVLSVTPPTALPGSQVTLRGKNLNEVKAVSLAVVIEGKRYSYVAPNPTTTDTTVIFRVPVEVHSGTYPISITMTSGTRLPTSRTLTIT